MLRLPRLSPRRTAAYDAMTGQAAPGRWSETRDYYRFMSPALGINAKGKCRPTCRAARCFLTTWTGTAAIIQPYRNYVYPGDGVLNGIVSAPSFLTPRAGKRRCARTAIWTPSPWVWATAWDWPAREKVLKRSFDPKAAGYPVDFSWESLTDPRTERLQGNSHQGARPFQWG